MVTEQSKLKVSPPSALSRVNTVGIVAEVLALHRWALETIARSFRSTETSSELTTPEASSESWAIFLQLDRCAAAVLSALGKSRQIADLPEVARERLTRAATHETDSVLKAEREARALGGVAGKAGIRVVLLKGAVAAVERADPSMPVADVDILVAADALPAVERWLVEEAFTRSPQREPHHDHWFAPPGRLPVEVHSTIHHDGKPVDAGLWSRLTPLDQGGLWKMNSADAVLHLLAHRLVQHAFHGPVSIRDVLLIGWYAARMTTAERSHLEDKLAGSAESKRFATLLTFAEALRRGAANDPFESEAIPHYAAAVLSKRSRLAALSRAPLYGLAAVAGGVITPHAFLAEARSEGSGPTGMLRLASYSCGLLLGVPMLRLISRRAGRATI